jgi:HD-GYP domain-containing protein (c-di-GMP phosphodiesterase class II)
MISFEHAIDSAGVAIIGAAFFVAFIYPPVTMRRATRQSCIALARAVESREPYQLGHSERTAKLVVSMAQRTFRFWPWQLWDIEMAALLHMIGKVGVAHGLLNSPAPPAGRQLFALREYVRVGAEIIEAVPDLKAGAKTIAFHREYLDGTGYPYGRYGDDIPFAARLLCIATEFVAMTSERVYRPYGKVMTHEEALDYFRQRAGRQYDAEGVALLIKVTQTPTKPTGTVRAPLGGRVGAAAK